VAKRPPLASPVVPTFAPRGISDLLTPRGLTLLNNWISFASDEWDTVAASKGSVGFKTGTLVLGQELLVPSARGMVWDLRTPGMATPLTGSPRARAPPF
jgi:hypothetical protein